MAFTGGFGSLIMQSMFQGLVAYGKAPVTSSMLNAIRCMSSSKLFIGGLSSGTDGHSLKEAFTSFGDVAEDILRIMIFPLVAKGAKRSKTVLVSIPNQEDQLRIIAKMLNRKDRKRDKFLSRGTTILFAQLVQKKIVLHLSEV